MNEVLVFAEAAFDAATATRLADRVLLEQMTLDPRGLDELRRWTGTDDRSSFVAWKTLKKLWDSQRPSLRRPLHGRFNRNREYTQARKALRFAAGLAKKPSAVLLVRDDDHSDRRQHLEAAREEQHAVRNVIVALASPEMEAWFLVGYLPDSSEERQRLAERRQALGFDPTKAPHRLRSKAETDQHGRLLESSTKNVLNALTGGDPSRRDRCLEETPLVDLERHGKDCGLSSYIDEVRKIPAPALARTEEA